MVTGLEPTEAGVPAKTPVVGLRVEPGGKEPALMEYVTVPNPPVAAQKPLAATPTVKAGKLHPTLSGVDAGGVLLPPPVDKVAEEEPPQLDGANTDQEHDA